MSVANPEDGTATVSSATVEEGANVTITATPTADGKAFNFWTGTGCLPQRLTHDASATFKVTNDCELVAHFATAYYVKTDGNDSKDGLTPATAKASVAAAVNAAQTAGDEAVVLVAAGTYKVMAATGLVNLTKAVTVRGTGATRDDVIIHSGYANATYLVTLGHENAALQNLRLEGEKTDNTTYGGLKLSAGLVTDCSVTAFKGTAGESASVPVLMTGGLLADSRIFGNSPKTSYGAHGGLQMSAGIAENCEIVDNFAGGSTGGSESDRRSGGVYMTGGTLRNCLVAGNMHPIAASGIAIRSGNPVVENCTIAGNFYDLGATTRIVRGVERNDGTATFSKCIIAGNKSFGQPYANVNAKDGEVAGITFTDTCFGGETVNGEGNITALPLFADSENGDYAVGYGPWDGWGYNPSEKAFRVGFTVTSDGAVDSAAVTLAAQVKGDTEGVVYTWTIRNADTGAVVQTISGADKATVETTLSGGLYTVTLSATNANAETDSFTSAKCLTVYQSETTVTAAGQVSLQAAIDRTVDGGTVHVGDGIYAQDMRLDILRGVRVVSENGPSATKLYIRTNQRAIDKMHVKPMVALDDADAFLSGFELRCANSKGSKDTCYGMVYTYAGGTVSNCLFNAGTLDRGAFMCARAFNAGRFLDCVIRGASLNPSGNSTGFCGLGITLGSADCLADRCVVSNCCYLSAGTALTIAGGGIRSVGGTVRNTLVVDNQHGLGGGGIYANGGLVENCTVIGNRVINSGKTNQKDYGLYADNGAVVRNCIVRDNVNTASNEAKDLFADESTTVEYCDFPTATSSVAGTTDENIDEDPLFDGATYVITRDSPCKGVEQTWMAGAIDLKGDPRVAYGIPDIGCYEYYVPATVEETLEVTSPYGEIGVASPAYGENKGIYGGRSFTASVSEAVTNEEAGVAYECTGWKLYDADGVEKDAGTGSSFTYTHPNPAEFRRLEWRFDRVFRVRQSYAGLSSAPPSTVTWVREGSTMMLAATGSEPGKAFNFWAGANEMGVQALHEASAAFAPTAPTDVVAQYSPVYYVAKDGNDEENNGLTPETAKATVAGAMALGSESVIRIGPGTYTFSKEADMIALASGITLCGNAESREDVILKCTFKNGILVTISDARAAVRHLTLCGNSNSTLCKAANLTAGLIADCHITKFYGLDVSSVVNATVYLQGEGSALVGSTVNDNHAYSQTGCAGGGVGMTSGTLVEDCLIYGNSCVGNAGGGGNRHGGGVFMSGGTIRRSLIAGNMHRIAGSGLSIYTGSDCLVESCTIVDNCLNVAPGEAYGVLSDEVVYGAQRCGSGKGLFRNCILAGNTAWKAGEYNVATNAQGAVAGLTFENCAFGHETASGEGNVVVGRPVFADSENFDYSVGAGVCADKGYRPLAADKLQAGFTLAADGAADESVVTLTAATSGNAAGATYAWTVTDADSGETVYEASGTDKDVVTPTLTSGVYTVSLTVTTAAETATFTGRKALTVQSTETFVTTADDSLTIKEAIRRTADGGTVHVADGAYYSEENIVIDRPVSVVSENGPAVTKLYGNPLVAFVDNCHHKPCFYLKHPGAKLSGFELRYTSNKNGSRRTTAYGITYLYYGGGMVSNCVYQAFGSANTADHAAYALNGGLFVDCVFRNGTSDGSSSSAAYCGLGLCLSGADSVADRCVVTNNKYTATGKDTSTAGGGVVLKNGAVLRNSYVADNQHARGGGGVWVNASTLENCTVLGNSVIGNENKGYGVYAEGASVLRNNIIRGNVNTANAAAQDVFAAAEATVEYNDYPEDSSSVAAKGEGNIDQDPVFKPGTYRLRMASPCVNAGKPGEPEPGARDLFGKPRVVCGRVDMGCHEFQNFGMMIMVR